MGGIREKGNGVLTLDESRCSPPPMLWSRCLCSDASLEVSWQRLLGQMAKTA